MIGSFLFEILLPACHSLKQKRKILNNLKDILRETFKMSVAEIDYHELWQRSKLLMVIAVRDGKSLDKQFQSVFQFMKNRCDLEIINYQKKEFSFE